MSKDPIKLTIGLGFAGVLSLMGLISFISFSQMNAITDQVSKLLAETNTKTSAANTMRDSIRQRGDTLYKMYLTDDFFERDEYRLEMGEHALRYKEARDRLYTFHLSAREAKLLDQLMIQTRAAKELNDTTAQSMLSDDPILEIQNNLRQANIARHNMLAGLNNMVVLQEQIAISAIEDTKNYQEMITEIIFYLSLSAFLIAIYIAQLVIRETTKKNSEIRFQATHDELTKLVNRKEFNHRLSEAFNTAKDNNQNHALCFLDLDKFKAVNDSCGHKAGDELLIQLTRVIKNNIRSHDTLARIGGDEFGLLLEGCSLDKAIEITEGIVSLIKNHEFNWNHQKFHVGVSIGLVMVDNHTKDIEKALSQADIACYAAKDMGRNQVQIHGLDDERAKRMHKELSWVADINNTAEHSRFSLHLQAIETMTGEPTSHMYEVLLRLHDDDGTLISPESYIPAAERFGLMKNVDYWVIEQTFKQLSNLYRKTANCEVCIFINISENSLTNNLFTEFVIQQFKKYNIPHDAVCLEISETKAIKNINQTADIISALRKYNIKFALDDFGACISSISYLKDLPVDYLKIDGNIIKNISHNTADKAMVAAISQVGKVMNIETVAKHVENVFTLNQLKEIGIDHAQGFYLDKPELANKKIEALKESLKLQSAK
ncbi:MAG: EAL domain-containing protein [Gammaproteobacteria bacterium]|nr:EAL domain-containing protein [Gammaproteobacteria bacterium]